MEQNQIIKVIQDSAIEPQTIQNLPLFLQMKYWKSLTFKSSGQKILF